MAIMNTRVPKVKYIVIDESSYSYESELLATVWCKFLWQSRESKMILAGDPYQLDPVVKSMAEKAKCLEESYMFRMLGKKRDVNIIRVNIILNMFPC